MHIFRQNVLALRKKSSLPLRLKTEYRKGRQHTIRHRDYFILIHNGFVIRYD